MNGNMPDWAREMARDIRETRDKVISIETEFKQYPSIRAAAYEAREQAEDNEKAIGELRDDKKWTWRAIAGAFFVGLVNLMFGRFNP